VAKPNDWDICVAAAYLRLIGLSQEKAAEGAGCGERSIQDWEKCSWWDKAVQEAKGRWLRKVEYLAMMGIAEGLLSKDGGVKGTMSRYVADRMVPEMKPPRLGVDANIQGHITGSVVITMPDNGRDTDGSESGSDSSTGSPEPSEHGESGGDG
jgi:hypothetical protein